LSEGDTTLRTTWVVSWRGLDEEFPSAADAMDRLDQLEASGIEAEMFEIVARRRRRIACQSCLRLQGFQLRITPARAVTDHRRLVTAACRTGRWRGTRGKSPGSQAWAERSLTRSGR
jgi:hypothetical protein